jgi:succinate-semialdehyde dehydrogenase/glutarate-semialdehyde dehydrogenase
MYKSINPSTEETISEYSETSNNQLQEILDNSVEEQAKWKHTSITQKLVLVENLRKLILKNKDSLAKMVTLEMGKTITDSSAEAMRLELFCNHALERLEELTSSKSIPNPLGEAKLCYEPLGVIFAITPWNAPLATPLRLALPALLTGNAVLLKPAPNVVGTSLLLKDLFIEAGFPKNLFNLVLLNNTLAENLISNPAIKKIAFVGSTETGSKLASLAGKNIKPILLELGGSDPFIVLKDANLEKAAIDAAATRCTNAGQVCCASKRMIIEENIYEEFRDLFISQMKLKVTGDPFNSLTSYGPIARKDIFEKLISQVNEATKSGAKILLNGGSLNIKGYFFSPVVLEESNDFGYSTNQEFFGPVASLFCAKNTEHAIKIANLSQYGLGSAVYTSSIELANSVAHQLENGFTYINRPPGLHPYLPFGGVKKSGFGKDCGDESYFEYVNKKVIVS